MDYRKAFKTTMHQILIHLIRELSIPETIIQYVEHLIPLWRIKFSLTAPNGNITTQTITIRTYAKLAATVIDHLGIKDIKSPNSFR